MSLYACIRNRYCIHVHLGVEHVLTCGSICPLGKERLGVHLSCYKSKPISVKIVPLLTIVPFCHTARKTELILQQCHIESHLFNWVAPISSCKRETSTPQIPHSRSLAVVRIRSIHTILDKEIWHYSVLKSIIFLSNKKNGNLFSTRTAASNIRDVFY